MNNNSKTNPYIVKAFEASTVHITRADQVLLNKEDNPTLVIYRYEYGYFIFVEFEKDLMDSSFTGLETEGYSKHIQTLIRRAQQHGCKFLQIDGDATEYEDLPKVW